MIYLDMDGVLADFNRHTRELGIPYNHQWYEPRDKWTAETLEGERIKNEHMNTAEFWATMPQMPDARHLFDNVAGYEPFMLSAKPRIDSPLAVFDGKLQWARRHLDADFEEDHLIVCNRSDKQNYVGRTGHRYQILVDDDDRNGKAWEAAKCPDHHQIAKFVHHFSAEQSLNQIRDILEGRVIG